jgi:hypothetical protein
MLCHLPNVKPGESAVVAFALTHNGSIKWVNDSGRPFQVNLDLSLTPAVRAVEGSQNQVAVHQINDNPFIWQARFYQSGADPD